MRLRRETPNSGRQRADLPVTCKYPIVFARGVIATHFAWHVQKDATYKGESQRKELFSQAVR